jgi:hypothetical protein
VSPHPSEPVPLPADLDAALGSLRLAYHVALARRCGRRRPDSADVEAFLRAFQYEREVLEALRQAQTVRAREASRMQLAGRRIGQLVARLYGLFTRSRQR